MITSPFLLFLFLFFTVGSISLCCIVKVGITKGVELLFTLAVYPSPISDFPGVVDSLLIDLSACLFLSLLTVSASSVSHARVIAPFPPGLTSVLSLQGFPLPIHLFILPD